MNCPTCGKRVKKFDYEGRQCIKQHGMCEECLGFMAEDIMLKEYHEDVSLRDFLFNIVGFQFPTSSEV